MGCTLEDFELDGGWKRTVLEDGRVLETAKAHTLYLGTAGVLYKINGKFQGFVGSEDAARWWALKEKDSGPVAKFSLLKELSGEYSRCQNCDEIWPDDELKPIQDIFQRVSPGEPMPSGECPDCGALCQPQDLRKLSVVQLKELKGKTK